MNKLPLLNLGPVAALFGLGACSAVTQQQVNIAPAPLQTSKNLQVPPD